MLKWLKTKTKTEPEVVHSCETCGEELDSVCTSVGQKFYHPDCFLCSICGVKIDDKFFLEDGEILCENDHDKVPHPSIMPIDPWIFLPLVNIGQYYINYYTDLMISL